jgi:hypothetical protein
MEVVAVLLAACFVVLSVGVWRRTQAAAALILIALVYNYALHAYVVVFFHDVFGVSRDNYWYDAVPYFVTVDRVYVRAVIVSLLFANAFLLVWFLPRRDENPPAKNGSLTVDGWPLLLTAVTCFVIGVVPWVEAVLRFLNEGASAYLAFKGGEQLGAFSGVLKTMFNIAAMCLCLVAVAGIGLGARLKLRITGPAPLYWGLVALVGMLLFLSMAALGDRVSLIGGGLGAFVLAGFYGMQKARVAWLAAAFLIPVSIIGVVREMQNPESGLDILLKGVREIVDNGEASTVLPQYVAMAGHIEGYDEGSLSYLLHILVPKFVSDERPELGPYEHFAAVAGFPESTGWGMNFMTDCYVNYGTVAVIVGACCLGLLYWTLFSYAGRRPIGQFLFSGAVAAFPLAIRSGIPGLKSVLVMGLVWGICYFFATPSRAASSHAFAMHGIGRDAEAGAEL